jgi:two-component system alkaline phosphatase synthesis response regulator PhoP
MTRIFPNLLWSALMTSAKAAHECGVTTADRILVIEDDSAVRRALKRLFELEGYAVDLAADGTSGLELLRRTTPSAVLLDLLLPDISGQEICQKITQLSPKLPVIVVSAKSDDVEKVVLLEMGAWDYVTKPFSPRELLARVRAALRRSAQADVKDAFAFDDVTLSVSKMELMRGGQPISLTCHEFKMLRFMVQNPDRPISREELLRQVWGYLNYRHTRTVDTHMLKLRGKLERDPSEPVHFKTVHGFGYKFVR